MGGTRSPDVLRGLGRGFAGALLFALPMLMTMEMWQLGVSIGRGRLALLLLTTVVLAIGMERHFGVRSGGRTTLVDTVVDAAIALLVGVVTALTVLTVLAVVTPITRWQEAASIVAIEALPATIGASFARSQLGEGTGIGAEPTYVQELFLMAAGGVVFAANIAPTEEIVLLAARMHPGHGLALIGLVLVLMHAFVYEVDFKGGSRAPAGFWAVFVRFTLVGFVLAVGISAYLLWTFGRYDDTGLVQCLMEALVLALPASVGAAAARLIL